MTNNATSILVLGASGGLGLHICREVIRQFGPDALMVGDYKTERGRETASRLGADITFAQVDVHDPSSLRAALNNGVSAVIVSVQQHQPLAQLACIEAGIPCLDVTVQSDLLVQIEQLDAQARAAECTSIVLAGLFPGLSGLMAKQAVEMLDHVDTLDVALCQNSQASTGVTGIADMLGLFAQPVEYRSNGGAKSVPGFSLTRSIQYPPPFGLKNHRLAYFIERDEISRELEVPNVNYWTGYDKAVFDRMLATLNRLKILTLFNRPTLRTPLARLIDVGTKAGASSDERCAVVAEATGLKDGQSRLARVSILAPSDYRTTAMSVVAMMKLLAEKELTTSGVHFPAQVTSLHSLLDAMHSSEVVLAESRE